MASPDSRPALMTAIGVMIKRPEAMQEGLRKLLTGDFPDLSENAGMPGFPWGGRILYFWPKGEEAEAALASGLSKIVETQLPGMIGTKEGDNLAFNAFFLAAALNRPRELYSALANFPRHLLPEVDVEEDPWADDSRYFLDKAIEANTT